MINSISRNSKHHWLLCLSLSILLSVFNTTSNAEKKTVKASKSIASIDKAAAKLAKAKPEVKTYTLIGYGDTAMAAENTHSAPANALTPQFAARRGLPGRPIGRPWNPAMRFGVGPSAAPGLAGRVPTGPVARPELPPTQ